MSIKHFRLWGWALIAFSLFIGVVMVAPQNAPLILYKLSLVTGAAVVAYYIDRGLFPYARPDALIRAGKDTLASFAMIRRAIVVASFVIGISIGL